MTPVASPPLRPYRHGMRALALILALALPAFGHAQIVQDQPGAPVPGAQRYAQCLAATETDDEIALVQTYEEARAWLGLGGGAPAEHCASIALLRLGYEEEAALRLEALTGSEPFSDPESRAELLAQAAGAWLLAGEIARAEAAAAGAIDARPDDPAFRVLRARVLLEDREYRGAEADLNQAIDSGAIGAGAGGAQALTLRAHVRLALGRLAEALQDAEAAVEADRESVDARLILGDVREAIRTGEAGPARAP